jgi:hypothetical protein
MKGEELLERFVRFAAEVGRVVDELPGQPNGPAHCRAVGSVWNISGSERCGSVRGREPTRLRSQVEHRPEGAAGNANVVEDHRARRIVERQPDGAGSTRVSRAMQHRRCIDRHLQDRDRAREAEIGREQHDRSGLILQFSLCTFHFAIPELGGFGRNVHGS